MNASETSHHSFRWLKTFFLWAAIAVIAGLLAFGKPLRQFARESLMQHVSSAHFEILFPKGALPTEATEQFARQQETLLATLEKKLGDASANAKIRVVLDPGFVGEPSETRAQPGYSVDGTTIRAKLNGPTPQLPAEADAQALLYAAWGKPGNPQIARWTAISLAGEWRGADIGMAAAQVEQKIGHQKLAAILAGPSSAILSPEDQALLGAAWISEVAEFGGTETVRKLYRAEMPQPSMPEITKVLDTTPLELERKWQLWMYSYLAGMPAMSHDSAMPADMPMAHSH